MYGWTGRIVRVNLTNETIAIEPLNIRDANHYIGGRGLGMKLYISEVDPGADPLSPENKLMWMTGPFTGTLAACAGSCEVIAKAPTTGAVEACAAGGQLGPELKFAGYDGIIFEGKAKKPVYLYLHDHQMELRDASHLWGKNVPSATDAVKWETNEEASIACIGPAGEKLVAFAVVMNDKKTAGGTGLGAVMGSKNLKAIAVVGSKSIKVAKQKEFLDACMKLRKAFPADAVAERATENRPFVPGSGIDSPDAAKEARLLCGELGLDADTMSAALECARKLYAQGYAANKDIGLDFPFESIDAIKKLIRMTSVREGFGEKLASGPRRLALRYGHPEVAEYAKAGRPGAGERATERKLTEDLAAVADSAGLYPFAASAVGLPAIAELYRACTGSGDSDKAILQTGERICNVERLLSLESGSAKKADNPPTKPANKPANANAGKNRPGEQDKMLRDYYTVRGWDQNGVPSKAKKKELSIEFLKNIG